MAEIYVPKEKILVKELFDGRLRKYSITEVNEDMAMRMGYANEDFQEEEKKQCLMGPYHQLIWFHEDEEGFADFRSYTPRGAWALGFQAMAEAFDTQIWEIDAAR